MTSKAFRFSKSLYVAGLQCTKQLWWRLHEPEATELAPDETLAWMFEQGREVGARARECVPGGILIGPPGIDLTARIGATRAAMKAGAQVLYEAAVEHDGVVVVADILVSNRKAWTLIEVKSTTSVKDEHIHDLAVQTWVLRGAGIEVRRMELMHLNHECRFPDLGNLFIRENVSGRVEAAIAVVAGKIAAMRAALAGSLPDVPIGKHCHAPYDCAFLERCWGGVPPNSLWSLYKLKAETREALEGRGITTIAGIPAGEQLSDIQSRQRRAVTDNELVAEPGLGAALNTIEYPVTYLDFETIWPAIPVWPGMRPYDHAPVQVSLHVQDRAGTLQQLEWLADGPEDARPEMGRWLVESVPPTGSVVVYNAGFEHDRLAGLEELLPERAPALARIRERLWDLLPVVRDHLYHPDFNGRFGLKSVLPALVPDAPGYEDLAVSDGTAASRMLTDLLLSPERGGAAEREESRRRLLEYCRLDTYALVLLHRRLREIAGVA